MPQGCEKLPMSQILTYEEITRICRVCAELGIRKLRITGGEPFVRPECVKLIRMVSRIPGIDEVCVTTNGQKLAEYIEELKETTAQKASMESELGVARSIQMSMLPMSWPAFPDRKNHR